MFSEVSVDLITGGLPWPGYPVCVCVWGREGGVLSGSVFTFQNSSTIWNSIVKPV